MPDSNLLPVTAQAREIAVAYLGQEKDARGECVHDAKTIGEIASGKRDYAPAVQIAQFTLDRLAHG